MQLQAAQEVLEWLKDAGGIVHPSLELRQDDQTGLSAFTSAPIPAEEQLISCPFNLAITSPLATEAICTVCGVDEESLKGWNDRMRIVTCLMLHQAHAAAGNWPESLAHRAYVQSLPPPGSLFTPLFFSEPELELLRGTNMYGAIAEQRTLWESESQTIRTTLKDDRLTWESYLVSSTHYQSRAFPSKLLRLLPRPGSGSGQQVNDASEAAGMEDSYPILLPGVDILNHARAQPITWLSTSSSTSTGPIPSVIVLDREPLPADTQIFNNYGPKSNEELIFSYGFVLDPNPDDTVTLRLGSASLPPDVQMKLKGKGLDGGEKFMVKRDGIIPQGLLQIMRVMMGEKEMEEDDEEDDPHAEHEREVRGVELELDVLGSLGGMLEDKLGKLPSDEASVEGVRDEVQRMVRVYVTGQAEILEAAMSTVSERTEQLEKMLDQGMGGCPCCS